MTASRIVDRRSERLLIWFGGLHEPFISDASFDEVGLSSLNLLDARMDWYTGGIEGVSASDAETVYYLRSVAGGRPVICAGQSSGGYAAIRYGHALDAALVVAMSPQTGNRAAGLPFVDVLSLETLYLREPKSHPISLHVSRSEKNSSDQTFWNDHLHAQALAAVANVTIHQHPYDSHAVSLYLNHHGSFLDAVQHDMLWHLKD